MGADIHMYLEAKNDNGDYELVKEIELDRNYELFGLLAGVRGYTYEPIAEPRGLPDDLSDRLKTDKALADTREGLLPDHIQWLGDHSFSYLTLSDFIGYPHADAVDDHTADLISDLILALVFAKNDARLVFGFDS